MAREKNKLDKQNFTHNCLVVTTHKETQKNPNKKARISSTQFSKLRKPNNFIHTLVTLKNKKIKQNAISFT